MKLTKKVTIFSQSCIQYSGFICSSAQNGMGLILRSFENTYARVGVLERMANLFSRPNNSNSNKKKQHTPREAHTATFHRRLISKTNINTMDCMCCADGVSICEGCVYVLLRVECWHYSRIFSFLPTQPTGLPSIKTHTHTFRVCSLA